ncbi:hypothetical protein ABTO24_19875, partial [Acinetobacter baumannii]
ATVGSIKELEKINHLIRNLIDKKNYEYVDMLCTGNLSKILIRSGFKIKLPKDKNVIPIYFNPFIKKILIFFIKPQIKN